MDQNANTFPISTNFGLFEIPIWGIIFPSLRLDLQFFLFTPEIKLQSEFLFSAGPMTDLARLMACSVSLKTRREHIKEILHHYYDTLKSIAGDKLKASYEQIEDLFHRQFAFSILTLLPALPIFINVLVKSEGEQKKKEQMEIISRFKASYEDAMKTIGE